MSKDSVVVFMDYQNVHNSARRQFLDYGADHATGHVDPLRVAQLLCQRRSRESELKQVRVYRGRPNPERQPGAARANDRQTSVWQRSPLVHVVRRNLDYPYSWPDEPATEKGIDVAIAVDMLRLAAFDKTVDALVLFSSDKDLLPALEVIREMELCHVEVATWAQAHRLRYAGTQLPWCHSIPKEQFETVRDHTDYAASAPPTGFPAALRPREH